MNNPVQSYLQLSTPVDSFLPGDDKQLVDLDELYEETEQGKATDMVMGAEAMSLGKMSRSIAAKLNLPNVQAYDPFPSQRNSVVGAEGFFSTLYEGFKGFIEGIIKYIRMAFSWVANTVKGIFGFRKSERIDKAIEASLPNLQEEFKTTLSGLGFPAGEYNLEAFIGKLPSGVDRLGQLTLMKSKFETDKEAMKGLSDALPILQQCIAKLNEGSGKVVKASDIYKKVIRDEYNRTRVRASKNEHVEGRDSPEVNRLVTAAQEVMKALNPQAITHEVATLLSTLYKVEFTSEALTEGFNNVRKQLDATVVAHAVKLSPVDVSEIMSNIASLNARYVQISDNQIDMSGINLKSLGEAIDKTDADKVKALADYYGLPQPVTTYQEVAVGVRNYSNFCQMVSRQLLVVERQVDSLSRWYARAHMWYLHGLLGDMEKLRELNLQARAEGHNPQSNQEGYTTIEMDFITEADAKTFMEKFAGTTREMFDHDIADLRTKYNNLVKQLGIGKPL